MLISSLGLFRCFLKVTSHKPSVDRDNLRVSLEKFIHFANLR